MKSTLCTYPRPTHARALAAWQTLPLKTRREAITRYSAPGYPCRPSSLPAHPTLADWRRALIQDPAFQLADLPVSYDGGKTLHLDPKHREILDTHKDPHHRTTGYYCDQYQDGTYSPRAVELASCPGYVFPAYLDSMSGQLAIDLADPCPIDYTDSTDDYDAQEARRGAIAAALRHAHNYAEDAAEESRDWYEREEARTRRDEQIPAELAHLRQTIRETVQELRSACREGLAARFPAAAASLRRTLDKALETRRALMAERAELANA